MTYLRKGSKSGTGGYDGVEKVRGSEDLPNLKSLAVTILRDRGRIMNCVPQTVGSL